MFSSISTFVVVLPRGFSFNNPNQTETAAVQAAVPKPYESKFITNIIEVPQGAREFRSLA
jgi:hypothetical protein